MMKYRIMWLLWLIFMAGATVVTGFSVFGIIADLIGGSHKPGRKKNSHKVVCSEGCRAKRKLSRQTDFAESDSMASLRRKRTDFMGKSVYRGTW